jgi:hypothetical protein
MLLLNCVQITAARAMLYIANLPYNKQKLHRGRYFNQLLEDQADAMPSSMPELLRLSRLEHRAVSCAHAQRRTSLLKIQASHPERAVNDSGLLEFCFERARGAEFPQLRLRSQESEVKEVVAVRKKLRTTDSARIIPQVEVDLECRSFVRFVKPQTLSPAMAANHPYSCVAVVEKGQ